MNKSRIAKLYLALIGVGLAGTSQPVTALNPQKHLVSPSAASKTRAAGTAITRYLARHKLTTSAVITTASLAIIGTVALLVIKKIKNQNTPSTRDMRNILETDQNGRAPVYDKEGKWLADVVLGSDKTTGPVVKTANDCPWMIGPCRPFFPVYNNLGCLVGDIETSAQSRQSNRLSMGRFFLDRYCAKVKQNYQPILPTNQSSLPAPATMPRSNASPSPIESDDNAPTSIGATTHRHINGFNVPQQDVPKLEIEKKDWTNVYDVL